MLSEGCKHRRLWKAVEGCANHVSNPPHTCNSFFFSGLFWDYFLGPIFQSISTRRPSRSQARPVSPPLHLSTLTWIMHPYVLYGVKYIDLVPLAPVLHVQARSGLQTTHYNPALVHAPCTCFIGVIYLPGTPCPKRALYTITHYKENRRNICAFEMCFAIGSLHLWCWTSTAPTKTCLESRFRNKEVEMPSNGRMIYRWSV